MSDAETRERVLLKAAMLYMRGEIDAEEYERRCTANGTDWNTVLCALATMRRQRWPLRHRILWWLTGREPRP